MWSDLPGPMSQLRFGPGRVGRCLRTHCKWWENQIETQVLAFRGPPPTRTETCGGNAGWLLQPHSHRTGSCGLRDTCSPGTQGWDLGISSTLLSGEYTGWAPAQVCTCFLLERSFPFPPLPPSWQTESASLWPGLSHVTSLDQIICPWLWDIIWWFLYLRVKSEKKISHLYPVTDRLGAQHCDPWACPAGGRGGVWPTPRDIRACVLPLARAAMAKAAGPSVQGLAWRRGTWPARGRMGGAAGDLA